MDQSVFEKMPRSFSTVIVEWAQMIKSNSGLFQLHWEHFYYFFNNTNFSKFCQIGQIVQIHRWMQVVLWLWAPQGKGVNWAHTCLDSKLPSNDRGKEDHAKKKRRTTVTYITYTPNTIFQLKLYMLLTFTSIWQHLKIWRGQTSITITFQFKVKQYICN